MSFAKQTWRLFLKSAVAVGERAWLPEEEHHYAHHVLRLGVAERVEVGDGAGFVASAVIIRSDKKGTEVEIEEVVPEPTFPCPITLFLAQPKPSTLEEVVGLSAEMGVSNIVVFRSHRCQSKAPVRIEKLERTSREALRITKAARAPAVSYYDDFTGLKLLFERMGPVFLCDESAEAPGSDFGSMLRNAKAEAIPRLAILIGPEASFDVAERACFVEWGARPVSLGPLILRVPTAVAYAVGAAMSQLNPHYSALSSRS